MKIFFNRKIRRSAWGGGSHFATGFFDFLNSRGIHCTNQYDSDVDTIIMFDNVSPDYYQSRLTSVYGDTVRLSNSK